MQAIGDTMIIVISKLSLYFRNAAEIAYELGYVTISRAINDRKKK